MSLSQIELSRRVYNSLDFLSDIGGLFGTLGPLCGIIVAIFQYRGSYLCLMDDMGEAEENYQKSINRKNTPTPTGTKRWCCSVFCINLKMRCPNKLKCKCLKMNQLERIQATHYRQLEREIHIGYILSTLRALKMMMREKFSSKEWRKAFAKHSQLGYPSDDSLEEDEAK